MLCLGFAFSYIKELFLVISLKGLCARWILIKNLKKDMIFISIPLIKYRRKGCYSKTNWISSLLSDLYIAKIDLNYLKLPILTTFSNSNAFLIIEVTLMDYHWLIIFLNCHTWYAIKSILFYKHDILSIFLFYNYTILLNNCKWNKR